MTGKLEKLQKNIKILLGIGSALVLTIALLIFWPAKEHKKSEFYFHPDVVKYVEWEVGGQKWITSRPDRVTPWSATGAATANSEALEVDSQAMQSRLIALGSPDLEKMRAPSGGVRVRLGFGPNNFGEGVYNDGRFVWTEGLKRGFGFKASPLAQNILEEGQYAFSRHFWTWCTARPTQIAIRLENEKEVSVVAQKGQWYVAQNESSDRAQAQVKLDSTAVERWLGRHCTVRVDHFKDRANFTGIIKRLSEFSDTAAVSFVFATQAGPANSVNSKMTYVKKGQFWLLNDSLALHSTQFDEALKDLVNLTKLAR